MVLAVMIGYLLGAVPVSLLVARRYGVDLFATADGNPGAWNALEQLGARRAWVAFAGDGAKALLAGLAGMGLGGWWTAYGAVAAAMAGHAFPIWTAFRGGKSVMAFVGGAVVLAPAAAALSAAVCVVVAVAHSFTWGSRLAVFAFPAFQGLTGPTERLIGTGALMSFIGALFLLRRRRDPASAAAGAAPTT